MTKEKTATIIATNTRVKVYKSSQRSTWVNSNDYTTEYEPDELKFDKK